MMTEYKIGQTVNLLLNVVMGVVLGITGQAIQKICSPLSFIQTFCLTMGVGFLLGSYIPVMQIGQAFANLFSLKKEIGNYLVSTFAISIVMVNAVTLTSVFIQTGTMFFTIFPMLILPFLIVGTIAIESSLWLLQKLVIKHYTK